MKKIFVLVILLIFGTAAAVGLILLPDLQKKPASVISENGAETAPVALDPLQVMFSHNNTFYDENIDVELYCENLDAVIYYTMDGTIPDETATMYQGAISVRSGNKVNATTIRAAAFFDGESYDYQSKSYVTGKDVFERFDDGTYVFVLSTDPYNLYDYYYGVAVEGYVRDEWLENEYAGGEIPYDAPANWFIHGRESERDMYVEVYDSNGNKLIEQAAGGRVVGGVSRAVDQKSWRLIARNEYSEGNGKFSFAFFPGATDAYGQLITKYDRLTLRNNANDREFASVRDEIALQLADNAGFPDIQDTAPAAVFLNGEYYGFSWLHEAYCEDYLETTYGGNKDNFRIVEGKENEVTGDDEQSVDDYQKMYELVSAGLADDAKFEEFISLVDIDNLMLYYAIQIYIGNEDWPGNNFRAWRYYPTEGEQADGFLDGRWRFMLFDVEYSQGLYGNGYNKPTLTMLQNGRNMQGASGILIGLLERKDMQEKLTNTLCDLMYGEFSYENALEVIEEKIAMCDVECMYALDNGYTSTWAHRDTFADSRQQIRDFYKNRARIILADLIDNFELNDEMYTITLSNGEGGKAFLNTRATNTPTTLESTYFTEYKVLLSAQSYTGYEFSHWLVNGETYTDSEIMLDYSMAIDGKIALSAYYKKINVSDELLYIESLYTAGNGDWFVLHNPNSVSITTKNLYLSDDFDELNKWMLPTVTIEAESSITIVCKNNKESSALKKLQANFSLKTGETLYLVNDSMEIISYAAVVNMDKEQMLMRQGDGSYEIVPLVG